MRRPRLNLLNDSPKSLIIPSTIKFLAILKRIVKNSFNKKFYIASVPFSISAQL